MAHSLEARVPFLDTVVADSRTRCRRATRCAASARRGCCARRASRCCRARSCTAASAASRSLARPGCAASSSRSRATFSRDETSGGRAISTRRRPARARRPRRGTRRPVAPALGPARAGALARGACRANAGRAAERARRGGGRRLKIWVDMTASAHVLVFRPLIALLREQGHEVEITSRDYAQTQQLLELHGLESEVIGRHGGRSRLGKATALARGCSRLHRFARRAASFDLALAHGSHELTMSAARSAFRARHARLRVRLLQHTSAAGRRRASSCPRRSPPTGSRAGRAARRSWCATRASRRSTTSPTSSPTRRSSNALGVDGAQGRRRAAPATGRLALPPPLESALPADARPSRPRRRRSGGRHPADGRAARLCRAASRCPPWSLPERAVDAQSLIAASDLVVSAGGTMNREAVALGVPVYTTYGGRLGGVDELLIRERKLVPLTNPRALELRKRDAAARAGPPRPARAARADAHGRERLGI